MGCRKGFKMNVSSQSIGIRKTVKQGGDEKSGRETGLRDKAVLTRGVLSLKQTG